MPMGLDPATVASAASREISAVIKLVQDLIRVDHKIHDEVDKRKIRRLCMHLRAIYFEPDGILGQIEAVLSTNPDDMNLKRKNLAKLQSVYEGNNDAVSKALKEIEELKAKDNLNIDLEIYETLKQIKMGKGRVTKEIVSVIDYAFNDVGEWGNFPDEVREILLSVAAEAKKLNSEIVKIEKQMRATLK